MGHARRRKEPNIRSNRLCCSQDWSHKSSRETCDDAYRFDSDPTRISDGVLGGFWLVLYEFR